MKLLRTIMIASSALIVSSCGSGGGSGDGGGGNAPAAVVLAYPANNSECETGESVSSTQSHVIFEWNAAANADSYSVYVKNLLTQGTLQYQAGSATTLDIQLAKATPYSWYVVSKREGSTQTGTSEKWKFYNSGEAISSYVPFPADVVAPPMSATVAGSSVTLKWETSDIDNDIADYKVYFGTVAAPSTLLTTTSNTEIANVAVGANTTYYWKVVTTDSAGNASESAVFQFKTN